MKCIGVNGEGDRSIIGSGNIWCSFGPKSQNYWNTISYLAWFYKHVKTQCKNQFNMHCLLFWRCKWQCLNGIWRARQEHWVKTGWDVIARLHAKCYYSHLQQQPSEPQWLAGGLEFYTVQTPFIGFHCSICYCSFLRKIWLRKVILCTVQWLLETLLLNEMIYCF